jgi:GT2 family glycosyltransferase
VTQIAGITVGISTVDRPAELARCIDALLGGTRLPDEILVVDQGEVTADVVVPRSQSSVPIRHLRQSRRGLSAARNVMFEQAACPIVAVTDDDCVPHVTWLESIADAFARAPRPEAVTGRVLALAADPGRPYAVSLRTNTTPADYTADTVPWRIGTGANFAARRDAVLAIGGYDERLGAGSAGQAAEDLDLAMRLLRAGNRIRYEPAAVVCHERQTEARRLSTRWSYAHGIGALAGMLGRRRDRFAVRMLAAFGHDVGARFVRAIRAHDRSGLHQVLLSVGGAVGGLGYGWRASRLPRRMSHAE